jgi:phospholipid/cholesterol/gamma-HCH transport system permease protein
MNSILFQIRHHLQNFQDYYLLIYRGCLGMVQRPFYFRDLIEQLEYMGVNGLVIVAVMAGFIGMALSLQIGVAFAAFGLKIYAGTTVGIGIITELGPVLVGVIFAGRSGAGMASEIGSMVLGNQVDTLRVFGIDPIKKLVSPRIFASLIMMPSLTIIGDAIALLGGAYVMIYIENSSGLVFWNAVKGTLAPRVVAAGLIKPVVFGLVVATVGCYTGLHTTGGARGVRNATTMAFVVATLLIILCDFAITKLIFIVTGAIG